MITTSDKENDMAQQTLEPVRDTPETQIVSHRDNGQLPAVASTPMSIIERAIERGVEPAQLEKLMDLQERWEANQASKAFAQAMAKAQEAMPTVVKDRDNPHTNSRFASMEAVQKAIKPVYLEHGLTVSFSEDACPRDGWVRVKAVVRHTDGHAETYFRDGPMDDKGPKGNPTKSQLHGCQSTVSYLSRALLCSIFGVTIANEDDDGNRGSQPVITEQQAVQLKEMIESYGVDYHRFLKFAQVERVEDIPASKFNGIFDKLKAKGQAR